MSRFLSGDRSVGVGVVAAIALGFGLGFLWGWLGATRLAEPGGSSMDRDLAIGFMSIMAAALAVVGLTLATRFRRAGWLLLVGAVVAFGGYHAALAVGPKEPVARDVPGSLILSLEGPNSRPETVPATCTTSPRGDVIDTVVASSIATALGHRWSSVVVGLADEATISLRITADTRYSDELPNVDPEAINASGSASFIAEHRGPSIEVAPEGSTVSGTVSWTCEFR